MAKANNDTNDTLSRLTVLGTILVPMNLVTGLFGMNVLVPGQFDDNPTLTWFFTSIPPTSLTDVSFGFFGMFCMFKRHYIEKNRACVKLGAL